MFKCTFINIFNVRLQYNPKKIMMCREGKLFLAKCMCGSYAIGTLCGGVCVKGDFFYSLWEAFGC